MRLGAKWSLLLLGGTMTGCKDDVLGGDTGAGPSAGGSTSVLDDSACGTTIPVDRRYPQMAYFFTETPIPSPTGDRSIQRGFLLYGGMDAGSDFDAPVALDDLWLYDLTARDRTDVCRWYRISASTGTPLFGGAMVYREDERDFVIVGGFEDDGSDVYATSAARSVSLDSLGSGFTVSSLLPDRTYAVENDDLTGCVGPQLHACYDSSTCALVESAVVEDPCDPPEAAELFTVPECRSFDIPAFYSYCEGALVCESGFEAAAVTADAPGVAFGGAAWDPVGETLDIHGGVTGCLGTCSDWTPLFGVDLTDDQHLLAANVEDALQIDLSGSVSATAVSVSLQDECPSEWPPAASGGLHGLGAAGVGIAWSLANRDWTHSAGSLDDILIGGTAFQELIPSIYRDSECAVYDATCGWCTDMADTGAMVSGDPPCTSEDGCASRDELLDATYSAISTALPDLIHPAVVAMLDNRAAAIGGRSSTHPGGRQQVYVVDPADGSILDEFLLSVPRYGAGAVYDPVARKAYVFGGHASSRDVEELSFDDSAAVATGEFSTIGYEASLSYDGTTWSAGAEWDSTYLCGTSTCWTDLLHIHVPTTNAGVIDTVSVSVTYEDTSGTSRTIQPYLLESNEIWLNTDHRELVYVLPVVLAHGDSFHVSVTYTPSPIASGGDIYSADESERWALREFSYGELSAPASGWLAAAVPAWPGVSYDATASRDQVLTVDAYNLSVPAGYVAIAPGEPSVEPPTGDVSYSGYEAWWPIEHPVLILEGVNELEDSAAPYTIPVDSGAAIARVYADEGLSSASELLVRDYALGGGTVSPSLVEDADFVVERLGSIPTTNHNIVYLRSYEGATHDAVGLHLRGTALISTFDEVGEVEGVDQEVPTTTIHELTHWYYGENVDFNADTSWLQEAVPVLMEIERYPNTSEGRLATGSETLIASHRSGSPISAQTATNRDRYSVGPYVLSQFYWSVLARGYAGLATWWALETLSDATRYHATLEQADVEAAFTALTSSAFHDEWVEIGKNGVPLLGLTRMDYVASGPGAGGWGGVAVYEYDVMQVQTAMAGWDLYTEVPFVLACSLEADETLRPFEECQGDRYSVVYSPTVSTMAGMTTVTGTLTGSTALGSSTAPSPAMISLLRADRLLPGDEVGNEGAYSWLLLCTSADTAPCDADLDGDGAPTDGDCSEDTADGGASIYPFQLASDESPPDGTHRDYNCDEWSW